MGNKTGGAMLDAREVSRLLRADAGEPIDVRLAAVSAAVHLPLDEGAWAVVAREVLALLDTVPPDSGLRADIVRVASLVPVDAVRAALSDAAAGEGPAAALVRSILHRPSAEDAAALVAAAATGDVAAAEYLARVPVEDFDVDLTPLQAVAERGGAEMRFWAGLTLARRDPTVFDAVLESLDEDPPEFMCGSPWAAYDAVAAVRPLPASLSWHLIGKLDELGDTRLPLLVIWAATGYADAEGTPPMPEGGGERAVPVTAFDFSLPTGDERMASALPDEVSGGGPGSGTGEPAPARRTAWPHLSCEDVVVAGAVFPVEVGLGAGRDPKVEGTGALTVPAGPFTLEVELMLDPDGFAVVGDRVFSLDVTPEDPYPTTTVQLVAIADQGLARDRRVGATFRVGGEIRGYAARNVAVVASAEEAKSAEAPTQPVPASPSDVSEFPPGEAPDLSITISRGDDVARTKLLWSVSSHLVALDAPEQTPTSDIGETPQAFLAQIVKKANETPSPLNLFSWLAGTGRSKIARKIPPAVQSAMRKVAEAVHPKAPTILLVTEDPYVPWELAVLDPPLSDATKSPFLGAQAVVGRWPLDETQKPPPRPPQQVAVADQAVVSGVYEGVPGWNRLKSAEQEADELLRRWPRAKRVNASFEEVLACIRGDPPADVLHFALHGRFDLDGSRDGLVLIAHPEGKPDENIPEYLQPGNVASGNLDERRPLVFLNACQVGASNLVLGDYSGMAHSFLFAGASAVVAALWSIDDAVASEVALGFYEQSLKGDRLNPAEILRAERAKVTEDGIKRKEEEASAARLAYQFFGHPKMQLLERDQT